MATERSMPVIPQEAIDPNAYLPKETANARRERHEDGDLLSQEIRRWWRGDAHTHSTESTREGFENAEGIYSLEEIAEYYQELGLEFVVLTEHASNPASPEVFTSQHPISRSLLAEADRIAKWNHEHPGGFAVFSGVEANILFDERGEPIIDVPSRVLSQLDCVIASRHTIAREKDLSSIEASLLHAAEHPNVDVIGHPDRYLMANNDWKFLVKNNAEAAAIDGEMKRLEKEQKTVLEGSNERLTIAQKLEELYITVRKIVGKVPLEEQDTSNETIERLHAAYMELETRYLSMWERVIGVMAQQGKAFEINFSAQPSEKVVRMAADAGVPFLLNYDAHDFDKYKWQHSEEQKAGYGAKKRWAVSELTTEDQAILRAYKIDRLSHGPGVIAILRLVRWLERLEGMGVTPDRVVNSSQNRMRWFLMEERGKRTTNLVQIMRRGEEE